MKKLLCALALILTVHLLQAQIAVLYQTGFLQPSGVALDASGNLYVAIENSSVVKIAPDGTTVATYTGFNSPYGLVFDKGGNLYVASQFGHDIVKIDAGGTQSTFATGFTVPTGIAFDALGNLYVTNYAAGTISKVDASGATVGTFASGVPNPLDIAIDASGNLFVSSFSSNTVIKFDASGHQEATYTGFSSPGALAVDADGNLYICSNSIDIGFIAAGSADGTQPTSFISGLSFIPYSLTFHDNALYASDGVSSVYKITGGTLMRQTHRYVDPTATGNNDGSTWADAYTDFQTAIDAALAGDSIFVAQATYQPASGTSFTMKEGVKIFGGFLGTETDFSQRNVGKKAILKGNGKRVIVNDNNALTAAAVLDGFIVTGGLDDFGAGMCNFGVSPTVSHCIFTGNNANGYGGAMVNTDDANPWISNCLFWGNSANYGGAIYDTYAAPIITNCTFTNNTAAVTGSAICISDTRTLPVIINSIIWGNVGGQSINNYSTTNKITYSDIQDMLAGTGNVSQDPLFTDAANGDFTLQGTSKILDAGSPDTTGLNIGNADLQGNARITGSAIDMGAYEWMAAPLPVTLISFTGTLENTVASFEWQTGAEDDFKRFELQSSTDGNLFLTVATIDARGSNSRYTAGTPQTATAAYYRLKMVDNNGRSKFSKIVHLSKATGGVKINLYPNPAHDYLKVTVPQAGGLQIYDANGRLVKIQTVKKGVNIINISDLSAGMYYLRVNGEKRRFEKVR